MLFERPPVHQGDPKGEKEKKEKNAKQKDEKNWKERFKKKADVADLKRKKRDQQIRGALSRLESSRQNMRARTTGADTETAPETQSNILKLNPEQVARLLNVGDVDKIPVDETRFLESGAKLYIQSDRSGKVLGYAHDGADVKVIQEIINEGFNGRYSE